MKKYNGFTLLELLIVIVVIGIIVAIAIPSYTRYVVRAQRVEARDTLQAVANLIEQNYRVTRNYKLMADNKTKLSDDIIKNWHKDKIPANGDARYEISFVNGSINENGYILQAAAVGLQAKRDTDCPYFFYDQSGVKMASKANNLPANGSRDPVSIACWSK